MANHTKRASLKKFTSPVGTFKYPSLTEPDYGSDDYPDTDGSYKTNLVMPEDSPEAAEMLAKLTPEWEAAKAAAQVEYDGLKQKQKDALAAKDIHGPVMNQLFSKVYDRDTDEPTGEIEFKFKRKASGKRKKDDSVWHAPRPAVYDAKLQLFPREVPIWGGTRGKISFEVSPYFIPGIGAAGISLKLVGAQVLDLVTRGGAASADSMGFGEEQGTDVSMYSQEADEEASVSDDTVATAEDNDDF